MALTSLAQLSAVMPSSAMTMSPRRREAEAVDADDLAVEADVLVPHGGHAGLHGDALAARVGEDLGLAASDWRSKRSMHGMDTTRTPPPICLAAATACCSSEPVAMMMHSKAPVSLTAM